MNKFFLHIRRDQVNLLIYGPDRPYFKQVIQRNFRYLAFFNLLFSAFWKKIRHKRQQTYTNNQNQITFTVIIINWKLMVFLLCLLCKYYFLKNNDPKNQIISFSFYRTTDPVFFLSCPYTKKLTWFCLMTIKYQY